VNQYATANLEIPSAPDPTGRVSLGSEALRRLRRSGYSALRDVSCVVHGDSMRLLGRVPTYYLKQVAQAVVADVDGVRRVVNLIEVVAPQSSQERGT
jgi:osmotically-inducible protein OsmY